MTKAQRVYLFADLWPAACRVQQWAEGDDARRYETFAMALQHLPKFRALLAAGRDIHTADIDAADGFTALKNHLLMLADSVDGAAQAGDPIADAREKLEWKVVEVLKCLAFYPREGPEPMGLAGAEAYANAVANDLAFRGRALGVQFHDWRELSAEPDIRVRGGGVLEGPSQLRRLLMTLSQRLNGRGGFRSRAGHTLHEMRLAAGVPCDCASICAKRGLQFAPADPVCAPECPF